MFGMKKIVTGMLIGGGLMYFADHYHVVHTTDGHVVIPRAEQMLLRSTYADVRGWDATKWAQYPELSQAVLQDGRGGLLVEGTVDAIADKAREVLGTGEASHGTSEAGDRPPIIFEQPDGPSFRSTAPPTTTTQAPADDDSLLGRLSRQLQGNSATESQTLQERPLMRDVPSQTRHTEAVQPAYQPALRNDRVGLEEDYLPDDLLPSIHSAAVDRITSQIRQPGERQISGQHSTQAVARTRTEPIVPLEEITASVLGSQTWTPSDAVPSLSAPEPQQEVSANGTPAPLEVDAERLRRRMPQSLREGLLRALTPPTGPSAAAPFHVR